MSAIHFNDSIRECGLHFNDLVDDVKTLIFHQVIFPTGNLVLRCVCKEWKTLIDEKMFDIFFKELERRKNEIPQALRGIVSQFIDDAKPKQGGDSTNFKVNFQRFRTLTKELAGLQGRKNMIIFPEQIHFLCQEHALFVLWDKVKVKLSYYCPEYEKELNSLQTAEQIAQWMKDHSEPLSCIENLNLSFDLDDESKLACHSLEQRVIVFPSEIRFLKKLKLLDLSGQELESIPDEIGELVNMERLDLQNNQIKSLPPTIANLTQLRTLLLPRNQLKELPSEVERLVHLNRLILSQNQLSDLPLGIGHLTQLEVLGLSNNQLKSLPQGIKHLTHLNFLYLSNNQIKSLPSEIITNLTRLQVLELGNNSMTDIPVEIGKLTRLNTLNLEGQGKISLPSTMTQLQNLRWINLKGRGTITDLQPEIQRFLKNNNIRVIQG